MEKVKSYFLDSYALIEIIKNNQNFRRFIDTINFTGFMNLLEVHYIINKEFGSKKADTIVDKLKRMTIHIEIKDISEASRFRVKHIKRKLSYIDCLGYVMALNRNMKFLTGDKEFKDIDNVEFVK